MSSSSNPTIISQIEQTQIIKCSHESSALCEEVLDSSQNTTSIPILSGEILTENEHEDNLMKLVDELIHQFLNQINRRSPYRTLFRWTFDDKSNFSYSVVLKIVAPSPMI